MGNNILALPGANKRLIDGAKVNEVLVNSLRDVLAKAEAGDLQSFVGTGFTHDGMRLSLWSAAGEDVAMMLGGIAWLEHEYVARCTGQVTE